MGHRNRSSGSGSAQATRGIACADPVRGCRQLLTNLVDNRQLCQSRPRDMRHGARHGVRSKGRGVASDVDGLAHGTGAVDHHVHPCSGIGERRAGALHVGRHQRVEHVEARRDHRRRALERTADDGAGQAAVVVGRETDVLRPDEQVDDLATARVPASGTATGVPATCTLSPSPTVAGSSFIEPTKRATKALAGWR